MIHVHEPVHENVIMVYEFIVQVNRTPLTDPISYDLENDIICLFISIMAN